MVRSMVESKPVSTGFIPGLGRKQPYASMNQAVLSYRAAELAGVINHKGFIRPWLHLNAEDLQCVKSKHPLRKFQIEGVYNAAQILSEYGGVVIADDMGLGKTIEAIVLADFTQCERRLFVVPANTLMQWQVQYYKWTGKLLHVIKTKAQAAAFDATINPEAICTYELIASLRANKWDMIIYDEIQKLRGRGTKMSLAARDLRDQTSFAVGLTGTLQWGYTRDLWNPLRCLFSYGFGTADQFDFTYCGAYINEHGGKENKGFKSSDGIDRSLELAIRLSYISVSRTRRDVAAELPSFERRIVRIPATQKATIALHAFLRKELPYMNAIMSTTSEKTEYVLELLEGMPNAIIFTWTNADVALLTAHIAKMGRKVYSITGSVSKVERSAIIQTAAKEQATIVATIDSTGVGVDGLQYVSPNIIFHSLSHSPKLHLQAESRAHRIGQKNPVIINYIVMENSADELVINVLTAKSKQDMNHTAAEDKKTFSSLGISDESMQKVLDDWVKNATDELDENSDDDWSDSNDDES